MNPLFFNLREELASGQYDFNPEELAPCIATAKTEDTIFPHILTLEPREDYLFFKRQFLCLYEGKYPKPREQSTPTELYAQYPMDSFWKWLQKKIHSILYDAVPCEDPRFNPLTIYRTSFIIQDLTKKTIPLLL